MFETGTKNGFALPKDGSPIVIVAFDRFFFQSQDCDEVYFSGADMGSLIDHWLVDVIQFFREKIIWKIHEFNDLIFQRS